MRPSVKSAILLSKQNKCPVPDIVDLDQCERTFSVATINIKGLQLSAVSAGKAADIPIFTEKNALPWVF